MKTDYTVIGYYSDNNQPCIAHTRAANATEAAREAVLSLLDLNGWDREEADRLTVVMVLEGTAHCAGNPWEVTRGDALIPDEIECDITAEVF